MPLLQRRHPPRLSRIAASLSSACVRLARSPDGDGWITIDEARGVLSYTALELTLEEREQKLRDADTIKADGKFTRLEFVDLCCATLWDRSVEELQVAASVRVCQATDAPGSTALESKPSTSNPVWLLESARVPGSTRRAALPPQRRMTRLIVRCPERSAELCLQQGDTVTAHQRAVEANGREY
jgi:hypothetical protein